MLVYDRWGQFGRPVLLLHGLLFDRTMWWPLAAELTSGCTVVAPDLPGHGDSPARDEIGVDALAGDLAMLVNRLDLHRAPIVVGHATAAPLAAAFADRYATHDVITIEDSAGPGEVPEYFRPFTEPRHDSALLTAYVDWPVETTRPVFPHLADPSGFAGGIRTLLP
ncbi:alpha/beta fold hydrolase [Actinoplanes sp. NPDC026619]|uniref:alpha/beta fold hydrolase n=1 Tax=Actinoplanes sp. NPDC026619 TaxID=3155798 RepID=UPI0033FA18B9